MENQHHFAALIQLPSPATWFGIAMATVFDSLIRVSKFANDAAGLEKTLRLLQSLAQIIAAYSLSSADAEPWLQARKQFAIGRRYLRFFKWIDAFSLAYQALTFSTSLLALLESGKWSCLGIYLLLEAFTILDAMAIWHTAWASMVFVEAMKFWFYSISLSICLGLLQLYRLGISTQGKLDNEHKKNQGSVENVAHVEVETRDWVASRKRIVKRLVIDCCDIFIPGFTTGWLVLSSATVGMLCVVSTILASGDIWTQVQESG